MAPDDSPFPKTPLSSHGGSCPDHSETLVFLNRLTDAILGQSDPERIIATVEQMLGEHMKVSRVLVAEATEDGEQVNVQRTWSVPGLPSVDGMHRLADYGDRLLADYRLGRPHVRRDASLEYPPGPELEALQSIGAIAAIDVPVLIDGQFRVLVVVHQSVPRDWTEAEIVLVRQVADRTAAEVLRARALRKVRESELHSRADAEAALRSEFRLASALQAANMGICDWNLKTDRVAMDARAKEFFGFATDATITVADIFDRIDPADRDRVEAAAQASARDGTRLEIEYDVRIPGESPRRISSISQVAAGLDGSLERLYGVLADVTRRRQVEEEREQFIRTIETERANLAAVVEQAPAFICVLRGPDHMLELANDNYHKVVGRRLETGKSIRELLPEVEGQGFFEMLDEVYRSGEPVSGTEVRVIVGPEGASDRDRYVNFVYQALLGPDGRPGGVFVHGVDMTQSVRSREAIASSERRRRLALDAAKLGSFNINTESNELNTDPQFRRIFGCSGESITYEEAFAMIHEDDRQAVRDAVAAAVRPDGPVPYAAEYRVVHPDGSVHWVSARGGTTFGNTPEGKRLLSFDGTVADITDRRAAEQALAFQRQQLETIFRESPAAMALWRGEDLVFELVNPNYQALCGDRQLKGLPLLEAIPELSGQGFDEMLRNVLRTGQPFVGREVLARFASEPGRPPEDRYFDFSYLQVLDPEGRPWGVYDHAVDVTDRVLAREGLQKSEEQLRESLAQRQILLDAERAARGEAEMAGRMKDEFLATLSHELRTPLTAIVGWTQLLQMMPDLPQRLSHGLEVIARNAKAQTQIIEDILDMSRVISGKLRLDVQNVDLVALLKAGIETVQTAADAKGVHLEFVADPASLPMRGDPHRLHQVFWNLVSNAVKFTPKDGRVRVMLKRTNHDQEVEASVSDTGEGIEAEFLPQVFDRFRQADSSSTRRHGGLGLGLAIVKQIVEMHGGSVRAQSPGKGRGATFSVSLPVATAPQDPDPDPDSNGDSTGARKAAGAVQNAAVENSPPLAGVSVVAVDDEADVVDFIERLLTGCGATVRTAKSAADALELVKAYPPTVIVSDIGMPGEDGYSFIRKVRALPHDQGGRAPALAVTAYARTVDRVKALESGFQMHIAKPVDPSELLASVATLAKTRTM